MIEVHMPSQSKQRTSGGGNVWQTKAVDCAGEPLRGSELSLGSSSLRNTYKWNFLYKRENVCFIFKQLRGVKELSPCICWF